MKQREGLKDEYAALETDQSHDEESKPDISWQIQKTTLAVKMYIRNETPFIENHISSYIDIWAIGHFEDDAAKARRHRIVLVSTGYRCSMFWYELLLVYDSYSTQCYSYNDCRRRLETSFGLKLQND